MGGTIAVTIRTPDGQEYRMARWTNSLPSFTKSLKFIQKDSEHIQEYMKPYFEMKEDYKQNHRTGKFKFNMTGCYNPWGQCAPLGYGLVVIDMVNNIIADSQGYTHLTEIYSGHVALDSQKVILFQDKPVENRRDDSAFGKGYYDWDDFPFPALLGEGKEYQKGFIGGEELKSFKNLWDAGKIKQFNKWSQSGKVFAEDISRLKFPDLINQIYGKLCGDFVLDMHPFFHMRYDESKKGLKALLQKVHDLGFKLSPVERQTWKKFINNRG